MKKLGKVLLVVLIIAAAFAALWAIAPIQTALFLGASFVTIYAIVVKVIQVVAVIAVIVIALWLIVKVVKK